MIIQLPAPRIPESQTLGNAIETRRSHREFARTTIEIDQVSALLWAAQGITGAEGKRSAPSAGAQYPSQVFIVTGNVSGIGPAAYRYLPEEHGLELHIQNDVQKQLYEASIDHQPWVSEAAMVMVLAADFPLMQEHFHAQPPIGERGDRYIYLEAGTMAQNIQLMATSIDLGAVLVGGFDDQKTQQALNLNGRLKPTALLCVGAMK